MRTRITTLVLFLAGGSFGACQEKTTISAEPDAAVEGGAADANPDVVVAQCPGGLPGPKLVKVPDSAGSFYCMDEREVVNAEYKEFLSAVAGKPATQPVHCSWNTSFVPELLKPGDDNPGVGKCPMESWRLDSEPTFAVNCVDFCDAFAFCQWAGKRLCGMRGAPGDAVNIQATEAAAQKAGTSVESEWFNACTQGGATEFPYGDEYVPGRCVDPVKIQQQGAPARATKDVEGDQCRASSADFRGLHHLSGNLWEWVNLCTDGGVNCTIQGGAYSVADTAQLACKYWGTTAATTINPLQGFRCCSDAVP